MPQTSLTREQILTMLAGGPARIAELTTGLTEDHLHAAPDPGEWSANEVLAHLRACADMWGSSIQRIIDEDRPKLRAVNPRTWIEKTDYRDQPFRTSFRAFRKQRQELLGLLEGLEPDDWSRTATVTGAGKTLERSVLSYAEWMATHERPHIKQIARIVSALRT